MSRLGRLAGAVAGIAGLDAVHAVRKWPMPVVAALDWPAHVTTAALVLAALPRELAPETAAWALVGSVAIDVDHVPVYVGFAEQVGSGEGGRPFSHSLVTTAALFTGSRFARGSRRAMLTGLAAGTLLHFVRDIGTGPGLRLFWPLSRRTLRIPWAAYLAPVAAAALGRALAGSSCTDREGWSSG